MPVEQSNAMSSANGFASGARSIAAPPYLTTTVLPQCSRMYGSASRRMRALAIVRWAIWVGSSVTASLGRAESCRVLGVDPDVLVGEIAPEHPGGAGAAPELHGDG